VLCGLVYRKAYMKRVDKPTKQLWRLFAEHQENLSYSAQTFIELEVN
jgi:hypothetical protein